MADSLVWPTSWNDNSSTPLLADSNYSDLVNLTDIVNADPTAQNFLGQVFCFIESGDDGSASSLGAHISSIFVILVISTAVTFFPVLAVKQTKVKIPLYVYLFARYFGAGVIIATAFVHLLDPAYAEIGPNTCVGQSNGWNTYSWPPAIALISSMLIFLMDFAAERYVEKKYGMKHGGSGTAESKKRVGSVDAAMMRYEIERRASTHTHTHQHLHSSDQDQQTETKFPVADEGLTTESNSIDEKEAEEMAERSFRQQIAAFLILEFGVLFHSVIIGLTLGSAGAEFATLYVVIIFHQSFEGLGIGARLSAISFPKRLRWMPYVLCLGYGLTTPTAIAIGVGLQGAYDGNSFTANVVAGILDSISAGILMYTGFVELIARDFLFNPDRTDDDKQLAFMVGSLLLGAGIMALLGKWA